MSSGERCLVVSTRVPVGDDAGQPGAAPCGAVLGDVDDVPRRELGAGDFFGKIALLNDVPRTATVTAVDAVETFVVDREQFLDSIGAHARSTVVAEASRARGWRPMRAPPPELGLATFIVPAGVAQSVRAAES